MSKATNAPHTQYPIELFATDSGDSVLEEIGALDEVTIEPAPDAVACGAAGCRDSSQLLRAVIEGFGKRVLCPDHVVDLVRRKVIDR